MNTDSIPKPASERDEYKRSDELLTIQLPAPEQVRLYAGRLKEALAEEAKTEVQAISNTIMQELAHCYNVQAPPVKILNVRPRKVTESWVSELFGDYDPETTQIRLWMRTAVQKKATSYGTFLSTLCHEFCHHLDIASLSMPNSFHTRGFYARTGLLYHHLQNSPIRPIVWVAQKNGTYKVDWGKTMSAKR
ncbi:MAG TPA: hypothetical protein V6C89_02530 [Drouetiella sp.]